ncbi:tRNA lysidine(34) synthetase TilS [Flavivirga abyssicola]|uniref:tRNA lysidine(34) synthetase TilS n=1 Tax=Flavivirga abyssicola TaxID=3063533 RepID=UPI0026E013F9|nr:tRNA lysidine(34) synthetase TilS [Flavivirga sp. MEBiC07777]WVK13289.1 tRNA lysidine(34) synthetase TilS [Flavivirga sp. MEBiC07777]
MLEPFKKHINNKLPFLKESKLLIAISGGIDSIVLTHLCHKLDLNIALAHCNFNLRGKESDADESFVLQLAEDLGLEAFIESFDTKGYSKDSKLSTQMAARKLRYDWFEELASQLQFDYILTAHHADDNLETFLINLSRGTGLEGLTGIPEVNDNIVRPLLPFSREVIETYAKANDFEWREDSSNASSKYLRNKLRHDIVPVLKEINPQLLQNFQTTLKNLNDTADIVEASIEDLLNRAITTIENNQIVFKVEEFKKLSNPKAYLFEVFKDYGFTEWNDIADLLNAQSGKQILSPTHRLIKDRDHLLLSEINLETDEEFIVISETDKQVKTGMGILFFDKTDTILVKNNHTIYVDKTLLKYPLTVRTWKEGDLFYPIGMSGKKKLSKYFKDEKLSLLDKENIKLLCSGEDIVWVIGKRADNRFKVNEKTKNILKVELK